MCSSFVKLNYELHGLKIGKLNKNNFDRSPTPWDSSHAGSAGRDTFDKRRRNGKQRATGDLQEFSSVSLLSDRLDLSPSIQKFQKKRKTLFAMIRQTTTSDYNNSTLFNKR